ncbi:MAG: hypothetical protein AAF597_20370, partial [Bacteroidota bacterium]
AFIEKYHPQDLELRLEVLKALNKMQVLYPELKLPTKRIYRHLLLEVKASSRSIANLEIQQLLLDQSNQTDLRAAREGLIQLLHKRQQGNIERLFRLLGMRYPPADIIPAYRGLCSQDQEEKINALEFMDIMLEKNLKQLLIPVMEYGVRTNATSGTRKQPNIQTLLGQERASIKRILGGRDLRLKLAVIYLMGHLEAEAYAPVLERCLNARDKRVRDMATKALQELAVRQG